LLAVLVAAFVVARSCGSSEGAVSKDEALEIAREEISFEPDGEQIRNIARGVPQRRAWAVSLYTGTATRPERVVLVQIDSESGEVLSVRDSGP